MDYIKVLNCLQFAETLKFKAKGRLLRWRKLSRILEKQEDSTVHDDSVQKSLISTFKCIEYKRVDPYRNSAQTGDNTKDL